MITAILYSKDRPLQLDLCLQSISKNFDQASEIVVVYKLSDLYIDPYKALEKEHGNVTFIEQSESIFKDTLNTISSAKNNYVCFFTDDDIVYQETPRIREDILSENQMECFSLRMGLNITKRFHGGVTYSDTPIPSMIQVIDENNICWMKTLREYGSYWSYSMSVDGHIFRKKEAEAMFDEMWYLDQRYEWTQTPNSVESVMQRFWTHGRPLIASFTESVVVNSPNNRVQDSHLSNRFGETYSCDADTLLEKYLLGRRINIDKLDFGQIECPHTEINILKGLE